VASDDALCRSPFSKLRKPEEKLQQQQRREEAAAAAAMAGAGK